jgi:hypothetical protein
MNIKVLLLALGLSLAASEIAAAQVVLVPAVAKVDFASPAHSAVIPVGEAGAGGPVVVSYQGLVFDVGSTGAARLIGPVIAKTLATTGTLGPFRLTFAQLGITNVPACTVVAPATCPQYFVVIAAIGPGGSALSLAADSDTFSLAPLQPTSKPAAPSAIKLVP